MLVALGTVFMVLGGFIEILDLTVCALASLIVVFVYIEIGAPYYWLVWICTSLITLLLSPAKLLFIEYFLVFGVYPILKAFIEKMPKWTWWLVKIVYINAMIWALILAFDFFFGTPLLDTDLPILKVGLYLLINAAFVVYDLFITVMVRFYFEKFRHRILRYLK